MRSVTHTHRERDARTPTPPDIFNVQIKCKIVKFHFMAAACSTRIVCVRVEQSTNTPQNKKMQKIETDY